MIPADLTLVPNWVVWKYASREGKLTKIPYQLDGTPARSNDSRTWTTYEAASQAKNWDGIGLMFSEPYLGIDLDKCITSSGIEEWAHRVVTEVNSYTEVSPSGKGLHIICRGELPTINRRGRAEIYGRGRFFTMTGKVYHGNTVNKLPKGFSVEGIDPEARKDASKEDFAMVCDLLRQGLSRSAVVNAWRKARPREKLDRQDYIDRTLDKAQAEISVPRGSKRLVVRRASSVKVEPLTFSWEPVLPTGCLVHFGGQSSQGKSPVSVDIAARMSKGAPWPDGQVNILGPRHVLMMNVEDRAEDTILPRYILAGGDQEKLDFVEGTVFTDDKGTEQEKMIALDEDIGEVIKLADDIPDLGLIVIDPITNYLGNQRMNNEAEVRKVLTPLAKLAQRRKISVVTIGHLNKSDSKDPLTRMMGAAAFVGVARSVWSFGRSTQDDSPYAHIMAPARGSIGHGALEYRTEQVVDTTMGKIVRVVWGDWTTESAEDTVTHKSRDERSEESDMSNALREFLKDGERPAKDCESFLKNQGYSGAQFGRIRTRASVKTRKAGTAWVWHLDNQLVNLF